MDLCAQREHVLAESMEFAELLMHRRVRFLSKQKYRTNALF
jgi:hypothetical protein